MLLNDARAFDQGYINAWREYFREKSEVEIEARLKSLLRGCDRESQELAAFQMSIVRIFFDERIPEVLHIAQKDLVEILPSLSRQRLLAIADPSDRPANVSELREALGANLKVIDEALVHYGLSFLEDEDANWIRGKEALDIGAYDGDSAAVFAKLYGVSKVHAFEPNTDNYHALSQNMADMGLSAKVVCTKFAASDVSGGEITIFGHGLGAGAIEKLSLKKRTSEIARTIRIDDYCLQEAIEKIGLIKIDAEGAGYQVLKGASRVIQEHRPYLLISVYHTPEEFFSVADFLQNELEEYSFELRKMSFDLVKEFLFVCKPKELGRQ